MGTKRPIADDEWRIPNELWERIVPHIPPEHPKPKGGRPRMPDRQALDAILFLARSGVSGTYCRAQPWRIQYRPRPLSRMGVGWRVCARMARKRAGLDALKGLTIEWQAVVERTHSWMNRFCRLLMRWEQKAANYLGFIHFACAWITWRAAGVFG